MRTGSPGSVSREQNKSELSFWRGSNTVPTCSSWTSTGGGRNNQMRLKRNSLAISGGTTGIISDVIFRTDFDFKTAGVHFV